MDSVALNAVDHVRQCRLVLSILHGLVTTRASKHLCVLHIHLHALLVFAENEQLWFPDRETLRWLHVETGRHAGLLLSCITATHSAQRSHASSRDERHRFALSVLQSQRRFMYTWSPWQPGVLKSNTHLHATYHVFLACNSIRKMCSCEKKCLVLDKSCAVVNLKHWNAIYTHSCEFTTEDHAFNQWFYAEMRVLFTLIAHRQVNQDSLNLCAKIGNINLA